MTIYISYSRQDADFANEIYEFITRNGTNVFFDKNDIEAGYDFSKQITDSIKKSDAIILLVSNYSANSIWCRKETEYAVNNKKSIIPIIKNSEALLSVSSTWIEKILNEFKFIRWDIDGKQILLEELENRNSYEKNDGYSIHKNKSDTRKAKIEYSSSSSVRERGYASGPNKYRYGCIVIPIIISIIFIIISFLLYKGDKIESSKEFSNPNYTHIDTTIVYSGNKAPQNSPSKTKGKSEQAIHDHQTHNNRDSINDSTSDSVLTSREDLLGTDSSENNEGEFVRPYTEGNSDTYSLGWMFLVICTCIIGTILVTIYIQRRKINIKFVSNIDCDIFADNKSVGHLKANIVSIAKMRKGKYFFQYKPINEKIGNKEEIRSISKSGDLISIIFSDRNKKDRKLIRCFIAGSTKLELERDVLRSAISQIHNKWCEKKFDILSYTYEDFPRMFTEGGQQIKYDEFLKKFTNIAIFIISGEIGEKTIGEFNVAYESFSSDKQPDIIVFCNVNGGKHEQSEELKKRVASLNQYWIDYDNLKTLKYEFMNCLNSKLIDLFDM